MEPHGERNDMPALQSATVIMLRDGAAGVEVFLLKRHGLSDVLGGAYVFPGGKVDAEDAELAGLLDQPAANLHASLGEPGLDDTHAAALYVAAVREVFEETGVLYAPVNAETATRACSLMREGRSFGEVLQEMNLSLTVQGLAPWSRWITPLVGGVVRKRFDTRFFVAAAPLGQEPVHDQHEATESTWLAPLAALQQYWAGDIQLAPPQIMSLAHLSRFATVGEVLSYAGSRQPPLIQPEAFEQDGLRVICYPGDESHSVRDRAMPGPTRLCWRNKRFEPVDGEFARFLG